MEDSTPPKRHKPPLQNPPPPTISQTLTTYDGDGVEEDRISNLPDSILALILSKLPTRNAIAATVLSTKWKHLFASIPNLSIAIDDSVSIHQPNPNFVNFMHHLLNGTLHDVPSIRKFLLHCHHDYGNSHIDAWISAVSGLKVSYLTLFFHVKDTGVSVESLFRSETLVHLIWCQQFYADVPDTVCLPNLKHLYLFNMKFYGCESLHNLISGCPVLKELTLDGCEFEETYNLFICSPSLKFLKINSCNPDYFYQVVIDTPLLEALYYDDHVAESYWGMNLSSLLRAHIDVGPGDNQLEFAEDDEDLLQYDQNVAELVAECFNVDFLYLSMPAVTAIYRSSCAMPTFHNMTELKLGDLNIHGWEFLPHLLQSAPNLETLVLRGFMEHEGCFANFESSIPNYVPTCLSLNLQFIYFEEFNGEQDELDLVSYFLTTAEVLRVMGFSFCSSLPIEKQYITWSKLRSLEGCSKSKNCTISFANGISLLQSFIDWLKSILVKEGDK